MLSESHRAHLLNAVPSFVPKWETICSDHAKDEARSPKLRWTEADFSFEFCVGLGWHLGARAARGELHEMEWFFASLEALYKAGDRKFRDELTVGLLEDVIHSFEREGGGPALSLNAMPMGALTRREWEAAYAYTHDGVPPGPPPR